MAENNGKWQIAFWIVTVFFVIGISTITKYVVANDDKSTKKDEIIIEKIHQEDSKLRKEFTDELSILRKEQNILRQETNKGFTEVLVAIAEIKK